MHVSFLSVERNPRYIHAQTGVFTAWQGLSQNVRTTLRPTIKQNENSNDQRSKKAVVRLVVF